MNFSYQKLVFTFALLSGIAFSHSLIFSKKKVVEEVVEVEEKVIKYVKRKPASLTESSPAKTAKKNPRSRMAPSYDSPESNPWEEGGETEFNSGSLSEGKRASVSQNAENRSRSITTRAPFRREPQGNMGSSEAASSSSSSSSSAFAADGTSYQISYAPNPSETSPVPKNSGSSPSKGTSGSKADSSYEVSAISVENGKLIVRGKNLSAIKSIQLKGDSLSQKLVKISSSANEYVAMGLAGFELLLGKAYSVIIADAYGQSTFSIDLKVQDGSVTPEMLAPLTAAEDGYVLKWDSVANAWVPSPDNAGGGGGGGGGSGTVTSIQRGTGLVNAGTPITTTGTIAVNTGVGANQIPAFDNSKKIAFDSSNTLEFSPGSILSFKDTTEEYRLQIASNIFQIWSVEDNAAIMEINGNSLSVKGQGVCLANGTNCPTSSGITSVSAGNGLTSSTSGSAVTLDVDVDNSSIVVTSNKIKLGQMGAGLGDVLKWTAGGWAPSSDLGITAETDPNVKAFAKANIPNCDPGKVLGVIPPVLDTLTCVDIELDSDSLEEGSTNQFFTVARARAAAVADAITDDETAIAPSQNAVHDALALKQDKLDSSSDLSIRSLASAKTLSANSGTEYVTRVLPTVEQSGTAGYTGLLVNVTEDSTGSGNKKLLDLQVNGDTKFAVDSSGAITSSTSLAGASATYTSSLGNQLSVGYDSTNKFSMDVNSSGVTSFTASGSAPSFSFMGGNVGIGTAPTMALDVVGQGQITSTHGNTFNLKSSAAVTYLNIDNTNTGVSGTRFLNNGTSQWLIGNDGANSNTFRINGGSTFGTNDYLAILRSNGNVGIGTSNPGAKLHVYGGNVTVEGWAYNGFYANVSSDTASAYNLYQRSRGGPTARTKTLAGDILGSFGFRGYNGTSFFTQDAARIHASAAEDGDTGLGGNLLFFTARIGATGGPSERMRITSEGNVGIGTDNPTAKLHVNGNILAQNVYGWNIPTPQTVSGTATSGGSWVRLARIVMDQRYMNYEGKFFVIGGNAGLAAPNSEIFLRIKQDTAMGSAPTVTVEVDSSNATITPSDVVAVTTVNTAANTVIELYVKATNNWDNITYIKLFDAGWYNSSTSITAQPLAPALPAGTQTAGQPGKSLWSVTSGTNITYAGKVGIGVIDPTEQLEVNGNIHATGILTSSDIRLKKDIVSLDDELKKLLGLRPVRYNWITPRNPAEEREQIGLIAQDVQKVYPEAVQEDKKGWLRVNYQALISPIIQAIKQLYAEISGLWDENAKLKTEVAELKARNEELEKRLERIERRLASEPQSESDQTRPKSP